MRKKIASALGIMNAVLFIVHAIAAVGFLTGRIPDSQVILRLGRILITGILLHALLSLPPALFRMLRSGRLYLRLNFRTVMQQITGVLTVIFTCFHPYHLAHTPTPFLLVLIVISLSAAGIHIFIGLPRYLITFGLLREEKQLASARTAALVLSLVPTLLAVAGFLLYYPNFRAG